MVVAKAGSAPTTDPTDGTNYANASYGSGTSLSGGYVVYKGIGTSVNLTNLSSSTTYHFAIYEYKTSLNNTTQLTGNLTTAGAANSDPVISAPSSGSAHIANYEENGV